MPLKLISPGGGSVILSAPSTGSTYNLTVPAVNANVITDAANSVSQTMINQISFYAGYGPAFSAYNSSGTSIPTSSETKISFQTEEFDTNNCFASSRFTPNVAGYYSFTYCVRFNSFTATSYLYPSLYKNGSVYKYGNIIVSDNTGNYNYQMVNTVLAYANGSTDYFEVYVYQSTGSTFTTVAAAQNTYFQGHLVRAA